MSNNKFENSHPEEFKKQFKSAHLFQKFVESNANNYIENVETKKEDDNEHYIISFEVKQTATGQYKKLWLRTDQTLDNIKRK